MWWWLSRRGGGDAACSLPVPRLLGCMVVGGHDGHVLPLAACPPSCPLRQPSGRARSRWGGLDNAMPLAWKIHAKQLFPLGACSWMRLRSGRREMGVVKNAGGPPAMEHHPEYLRDPSGAAVLCGGCGSIPGGMQDAQGCSGMLVSPRSLGLPPRWGFFPLHLPGAGAAAA